MHSLEDIKRIASKAGIELMYYNHNPGVIFFHHVDRPHECESIEVTMTVTGGPARKWYQCKHCGLPMVRPSFFLGELVETCNLKAKCWNGTKALVKKIEHHPDGIRYHLTGFPGTFSESQLKKVK